MNIGILSYSMGSNYGAQAQTYALRKYIESLGHRVTILMCYPDHYLYKEIKMTVRIENDWYKHPLHIAQSLQRWAVFQKWIGNIPNHVVVRDGEEIDKIGLDLVFVGSDEILNCRHPYYKSVYMGVGINNTPKAYYAASSGALDSEYKIEESEKKSLNEFISYSSRDDATKRFLSNNVSKEISQVLDPTFLWKFEEVDSSKIKEKKYILLYSFDSFNDIKENIMDFSKHTAMKIVSVGRSYRWADKNYYAADENDWITCFRNSSVVVTDSFHGVVFAIKNNKDYIIVPRDDKLNKIDGMMRFLGIEVIYYRGGDLFDFYNRLEKVDATMIEKRIDQSKKYITQVIGSI